jgi:hypothetical protein
MNAELVYYLVGVLSGATATWGWMVLHRKPALRRAIQLNSFEVTRNMRRPIPPTVETFEGDTRP